MSAFSFSSVLTRLNVSPYSTVRVGNAPKIGLQKKSLRKLRNSEFVPIVRPEFLFPQATDKRFLSGISCSPNPFSAFVFSIQQLQNALVQVCNYGQNDIAAELIIKPNTRAVFDLPELMEAREFLAEGKFIKAENSLIRAQEVAKYAVGEQSVPYAQINEQIAICKVARGSYLEASKYYISAISGYLENSVTEPMSRCLFPFMKTALLAGPNFDVIQSIGLIDKVASLATTNRDRILILRVATASLYIRSILFHKYRVHSEQGSMETLEMEIERTTAELNPTKQSSSIELYEWYLSRGRWKQTLYELKHEDSKAQEAREAYEMALKVNIGPERQADLIRADAYLGLGDLARLSAKWEEADEYYKKAVDLTDKYFDRDSERVRRVIESVALVQFNLKRWIHAEGLLRRLLDYYSEHSPISEGVSIPQAQLACMRSYINILETRGRGSEVAPLKAKLDTITDVVPAHTFDPHAF